MNFVGVSVKMMSRGEHFKYIESFHRLIEERSRFYYAILPLFFLTRIIVMHLMITVVFYVKDFFDSQEF